MTTHAWHRPPPPTLVTPRLALVRATPADAGELAAFLHAERTHLRFFALPAGLADLRATLDALLAHDRAVHYLVRRGGELAGGASIELGDTLAEVSCWLGAQHAGRGVATELGRALRDLLVDRLALDTVFLRCALDNTASARIARGLGFVRGDDAAGEQRWFARRAHLAAWRTVWAAVAPLGATLPGDDATIRVATDGAAAELAIEWVDDEPYVIAHAEIGDERAFEPDAALAHGATLAVGALALRAGRLALRYGCVPAGLTAHAIALLLHEARRLRALVPRRVVLTDAFAFAL